MSNRRSGVKAIGCVLIAALLASLLWAPAPAQADSAGLLEQTADRIALTAGGQRWVFDRNPDTTWDFSAVQAMGGAGWATVLSNDGSFLLGDGYGNRAATATASESGGHATVAFAGMGNEAGNPYTWSVELEAWEGVEWVKRTDRITYEKDGVVHPNFGLLSDRLIMDKAIASFDPQRFDDVPFDPSLPLILARMGKEETADVAVLMNEGSLSDIGKHARVKETDDGHAEIGASAGPDGAAVTALQENVVEAYIYVYDGRDSSFGKLAQIATDSYWTFFDYDRGAIGYPLTNSVPDWKTAADGLLNYVGNDTEEDSDHTFIDPVTGKGYYQSFPNVDVPGFPAELTGGLWLSRGALTYAKLTGEDELYDNIKALNDRIRDDGFLITDGSDDDGWFHQWFSGAFDDGASMEEDPLSVSGLKFFDPILCMYYLYNVTEDPDYLDNFHRMIEFVKRHFSQDTVNYTQPTGYRAYGKEDPYSPQGGEMREKGLDAGGTAAIYSYLMLLAARQFDDDSYRELGLKTLKHALTLPYEQMYVQRTAAKPDSFAFMIRAIVEAYESFGWDSGFLDEAEQYAAEMLLNYYFNNYEWDGDGAYNTHPSVGMAHADTLERWEAFREGAFGLWMSAPLLKYRTPDTLMKMYAMARQNQLWYFPKNDAYLGYGLNNEPYWVPYEFLWQDREGRARELYGGGETFMMYMLFEAFATVSDDAVVAVSPTAVEAYQTEDHTFVLYNTSTASKTVTFKLKQMTDGDYNVYRDGAWLTRESYADLSGAGLEVTVPAETSVRIRAVIDDGAAAPSAPPAPTATVTADTYVQLTWPDSTGVPVAAHRVYRGTSAGFTADEEHLVGQTAGNAFTDYSIEPSTTYFYKIQAVGGNGAVSALSPKSTVHTAPAEAPQPASGLSAAAAADPAYAYRQIDVQWDAAAMPNLAKYNVYRGTDEQFAPSEDHFLGSAYINRYYDLTARENTTYYYKVTTVDSRGEESAAPSFASAATTATGAAAARDEFFAIDGWNLLDATAQSDGAKATLASGGPEGRMEKAFTVDLDRTPYLKLKVDGATNGWTLRLKEGGTEHLLQPESSALGMMLYDLPSALGGTGERTFTVALGTVGDGESATFDWLRFTAYENELAGTRLLDGTGQLQLLPEGGVSLSPPTGERYGTVTGTVYNNFDVNPYFKIDIDSVDGRWGLKVSDGVRSYALQPLTGESGSFVYPIGAITKWTGSKAFAFELTALGPSGHVDARRITMGPFEERFADLANPQPYYVEDFRTIDGWTGTGATVQANGSGAVIAGTASAGSAAKTIDVQLDETPYVAVDIADVSGQWALDVKDEDGIVHALQPETDAEGRFAYNMRAAAGLEGLQTVTVMLRTVGAGGGMTVNGLAFQAFREEFAGMPDGEAEEPETGLPDGDVVWTDDFASTSGWVQDTATIATDGNIATITENHPDIYYGMVYKPLTIDFGENPILAVKVTEVDAQWGLKLQDENGQVATFELGTSRTGEFSYNLATVSGWTGAKNVNLQIWAVGEGTSLKADWVKIIVPPTAGDIPWSDDFADTSGWVPDSATVTTDGNIATITENHPDIYYGMIYKPVAVDFDEHPVLEIQVTGVDAEWGLKMQDGSGQVATFESGTSRTGTLSYDLAGISGWSGTRNVNLQLWVVGEGTSVRVDRVRIVVPEEERITPPAASAVWTGHNVIAVGDGSALRLTEHSPDYAGKGYISFDVTADLDATPFLGANVTGSEGGWSVAVNDGSGDIELQPATSAVGERSYDLVGATGWSGRKTFELKLYALGIGRTVTLDWLRLGHRPFPVTEGTAVRLSDGLAAITQTDTAYYWGSTNLDAVVNVDEYPYLEIDVPKLDPVGLWGLKVFDGSEVKAIQPDSSRMGRLTYNLKQQTGWSGSKAFAIQLFAIGSGKTVYVKSLRSLNIGTVTP